MKKIKLPENYFEKDFSNNEHQNDATFLKTAIYICLEISDMGKKI